MDAISGDITTNRIHKRSGSSSSSLVEFFCVGIDANRNHEAIHQNL